MRVLTLLVCVAACAAASCPAVAPLLVRQHTAIFVAGPIVCVLFVGSVIAVNMLVLRRTTAGGQMPMASLSVAWLIFGGVCLVWFWSAFAAGYAPEYVHSLYVAANATNIRSVQRTFPCTKVTNCVCTRSADLPCVAVEATLLRENRSQTAPCAGGSCCARTQFRCTSFRTICSSRNFCTTTCRSGVNDCVERLPEESCTAVRGMCFFGEVEFGFVTGCNESASARFTANCNQDQACVDKFVDTYINAKERRVFYASWDWRLQTSKRIVPKGQTANIVFPLIGLACLCILQLGVIVVVVVMPKLRDKNDVPNATQFSVDGDTAAYSTNTVAYSTSTA